VNVSLPERVDVAKVVWPPLSSADDVTLYPRSTLSVVSWMIWTEVGLGGPPPGGPPRGPVVVAWVAVVAPA